MSIATFAAEIDRFLAGQGGEVLCITGKWGVGKTFAWNHFLADARSRKRISCERYAYVSLFGQNSLDDIRHALFEGSVKSSESNTAANFASVKASMDTLRGKWRNTLGFAKLIPTVADYAAIAGRLGFLSIRDQLVCLDDLERAGDGLTMKDVLGLVSFLKEQRQCRIVLLLNEEQLADHQGAAFRSQLEKVADTVMTFEPTPVEAAEIGIDKNTPFHKDLAGFCVDLGILNIRTIKKIEKFCSRLSEELINHDNRVIKQVIQSATLFGFAKFQPDDAPPLHYLKMLNPYAAVPEPGPDDPHQKWRDVLRNYNFQYVDEMDSIILAGIERGHFDTSALKLAADALDKKWRLEDHDASFSEAWNAYHDSFDDNESEVLDGFENAILTNAVAITPGNFSSTIAILKQQGRGTRTADLIEHYVRSRDEPPEFWNLNKSTFGDRVADPDVRAAFERKFATFPDDRDVATLLIRIAMDRGWNSGDIPFLAKQRVETYRDVFKRLRNPDLRRAISGGLTFRSIQNADSEMQAVTTKVTEALKLIASESALNRARVAEKGVVLDE